MIVCPDPENCQPYGEHFQHHQAGREATRHGHRCERHGGESWCLCAKRQKEAGR